MGRSVPSGQLDTHKGGKTMNRLLMTLGNGTFYETSYIIPEMASTEIRVKNIMTGVCRSDVDMMVGEFGPLPDNMQGHEGLGEVIEVGKMVYDVQIGDIVATRGEPAYADFYNVRAREYIKVPEAHPRYILEPVACGINAVNQFYYCLKRKDGGRLLLNGSGFLASVAYRTLKINNFNFDITVLGYHNQELFGRDLKSTYEGEYDVIIDLKGDDLYPIANNGILVNCVAKAASKKQEEDLLWRSVMTVRPSPRSPTFHNSMEYAAKWIDEGSLDVDKFWTRAYNRDTEWQQAFADSLNRPENYSRGYIVWQ